MTTENLNLDSIWFEEQLSLYIRGKLSPADETLFLKLLNENSELKDKAIVTARLAKAMQQVGVEQDVQTIEAFKTADRQEVKSTARRGINGNNVLASERTSQRIKFLSKRFIISISVAASILVCVFGGYKYYRIQQVKSLGYEYLVYDGFSDMIRGESDSTVTELRRLSEDIKSKQTDLSFSIERLETMWTKATSEEYNDYSESMPEIGWVLANAYLCDNSKEKAVIVLDRLAEEYPKGTAFGDRVRELRDRIGKL